MQLERLHGIIYRVVDVNYRQFFDTTKHRFAKGLTNKIPFNLAFVYAILAPQNQKPKKLTFLFVDDICFKPSPLSHSKRREGP